MVSFQLNVFPDVDLQYLEELCLYNTGNLALNNICFVLSDNKYPRAQPKETIETGKTTKVPNPLSNKTQLN